MSMSTQHLTSGGITLDLEAGAAPQAVEPGAVGVFPIPNENRERVKTLKDLALSDITLNQFPVVEEWRRKLFSPEGTPEICDELPRLLTEFLRNPAHQRLSPYIRRCKSLRHIFAHKGLDCHL